MKCEICGNEYPNKLHFVKDTNICSDCNIQQNIYCLNCGLKMGENKSQCESCGYSPESDKFASLLGVFDCEIKNIPVSIGERFFLNKPTESLRNAQLLINKNFIEIGCLDFHGEDITIAKFPKDTISRISSNKVPTAIILKPGLIQGLLIGAFLGLILTFWLKAIGFILGLFLGLGCTILFHNILSSVRQTLIFELSDGNQFSFVINKMDFQEIKEIFNQVDITISTQ